MAPVRILLATDEVSIIPDYARQLFDRPEWFGDDPAPVSRQLAAELEGQGFLVGFTELGQVAASLDGRARLGIVYHGVVLLTVRVWRPARTLRSAIESVRGLPEGAMFENGVRMRTTPIAIANPMNLIGIAKQFNEHLEWIERAPWVCTQRGDESAVDTTVRSLCDWQLELLAELTYAGYGIGAEADGTLSVFACFARPRTETVFFGPAARIQGLRQTGFLRLPSTTVAISPSLNALEHALNDCRKLPPREQEPLLQRCLEQHPILLTQGFYDTPWARKPLRDPDPLHQDLTPDFVMAPHEGWEDLLAPTVVEIKSPEQLAIRRGQLTGHLLKALEQLMGRYRRFYEDVRTRDERLRAYGRPIERPNYALLIDRHLTPEDRSAWNDRRRSSEWKDVRLITYGDLVDRAMDRVRLEMRVAFKPRTG